MQLQLLLFPALASAVAAAAAATQSSVMLAMFTVQLLTTLSCHSVAMHVAGYKFLPRDALECKARSCDRMSSVRLSVRLSVTLVDQDHIGWQSWKLIARTLSPTRSTRAGRRLVTVDAW